MKITLLILIIVFETTISLINGISAYDSSDVVCDNSTFYNGRLRVCSWNDSLISVQENGNRIFNGEIKIKNKDVYRIFPGAFENLTITKLILLLGSPDMELEIQSGSFRGLSQLKTLEISSGVVTIRPHLLEHLKSLEHVGLRINGSRQDLRNAFEYLENLKSVKIYHSKLRIINNNTFASMNSRIDTLKLPENDVESIGRESFLSLKGLLNLQMVRNDLAVVERGAFDGLEKLQNLDLSYNKITKIEKSLFTSLKSLTHLKLDSNRITKISRNSFGSGLIELSLRANNIESLRAGLFDGLESLKYLILDNNKLTNIPKNLFSRLNKLRNLHLSFNKIMKIQKNAFNGMTLNKLLLNRNNLSSIKSGDFRGLTAKTLDLSGNLVYRIQGQAFSNSTIMILNLKDNRMALKFNDKTNYGLLNTTLVR